MPESIVETQRVSSDTQVSHLVSHLFRHKAGQMVSTLTRLFGVEHLQLAEDVVQETLLQALQQWPYRGVPDNPGAWLAAVARNRALDVLRRESTLRTKLAMLDEPTQYAGLASEQQTGAESFLDDPFGDDQLTMMFLCCHPSLSREAQVALTLKTVGGFGVSEIARGFLVSEETVAQRLVRAKRKLREEPLPFALPAADEWAERLEAVLQVLYLLFNEGYTAYQGENLVRQDLCAEAIRLCSLLAGHALGSLPKVHALLALMLLQASRLDTRVDAAGNLLLLAEQDRSQWDREAIQGGLYHLERAGAGDELTEYHLLAGIAACHAVAPSYETTDWRKILFYYDSLILINPSPVIALNRAVAIAMVQGPHVGLSALDEIKHRPELHNYYLLPATYGELYERIGEYERAAACYREALACMGNEAERRFLLRKLGRCQR